jgi:hypothetical protein
MSCTTASAPVDSLQVRLGEAEFGCVGHVSVTPPWAPARPVRTSSSAPNLEISCQAAPRPISSRTLVGDGRARRAPDHLPQCSVVLEVSFVKPFPRCGVMREIGIGGAVCEHFRRVVGQQGWTSDKSGHHHPAASRRNGSCLPRNDSATGPFSV